AEAAWLAGDVPNARSEVEYVLPLAELLDLHCQRVLSQWAERTQVNWKLESNGTAPSPRGSSAWAGYWDARHYPYETADALGDSDDEQDLRDALERLTSLGAR